MAGLGIKVFNDGATLTAAEINGYLMDQSVSVFEDAAARDASFGGSGEPVLSEGRLCYLKSTKVVQYYNGSQWLDSESFAISLNSQVSEGILQLDRLVDGTAGQIIVCNSSGVPTYVTLSGDATISSTGVLSLPQDIDTSSSPTFVNLTLSGSASITGNASISGSVSATGNVVSHITTASVANSASITAASDGRFIETDSSTAGTIYVTGNGWTVGSQVTIMQMSASTSSASISFPGQTLRGTPLPSASPTVAVLRTQYSSVTLINRGTNDWYVIGDLKA